MQMELLYYGQNDGTTVPEIVMTGDPGVDNAALTAAGYISGRIMSIVSGNTASPNTPVSTSATGLVIHPCDGAASAVNNGSAVSEVPYGTLLLGAGQFPSSITPSGSGRTPVVRAFAKFNVGVGAFAPADTFKLGQLLYSASGTDPQSSGAQSGQYTNIPYDTANTAGVIPVGICTHVPTQANEPWLGVASLL